MEDHELVTYERMRCAAAKIVVRDVEAMTEEVKRPL